MTAPALSHSLRRLVLACDDLADRLEVEQRQRHDQHLAAFTLAAILTAITGIRTEVQR